MLDNPFSLQVLLTHKGIGPTHIKRLQLAGFITLKSIAFHLPTKFYTVQNNLQSSNSTSQIIALHCKMLTFHKSKNYTYIQTNLCKLIFLGPKPFCTFIKNHIIIAIGRLESNNSMIHPKIWPAHLTHIPHYLSLDSIPDITFNKIAKLACSHINLSLTLFNQQLSLSTILTQAHTNPLAITSSVTNPTNPTSTNPTSTTHNLTNPTLTTHTPTPTNPTPTTHNLTAREILALLEISALTQLKKQIQHPITLSNLQYTLPFTPTSEQQSTIDSIQSDFAKGLSSSRILFGDVGTGKTLVALAAIMMIINSGKTAIYLAPTTILAKQVHAFLSEHINSTNITLITSSTSSRVKNTTIPHNSHTQVIVGTHALFNKEFDDNVALVIIDEQHKFGVQQRAKLLSLKCHHISMTATPIPRTMMQIFNNHISVSYLTQKPKPTIVKTYLTQNVSEIIQKIHEKYTKMNEKMQKMNEKCTKNARFEQLIYWICPSIDDNKLDLANVTNRHKSLISQGFIAGLIHGKLSSSEQEQIYLQSLDKHLQILIATTIIEVGVHIPHAHIIIIESANRLGLAQLHQLRGRVGRDGKPGICILISEPTPRLKLFCNTTDCQILAQADMQFRGYGNLYGTTQSGFNHYLFLDPTHDLSNITTHLASTNLSVESLSKLINLFDFSTH